MIVEQIFGMRYVSWKPDLAEFDQNDLFSKDLDHSFSKNKYSTLEGNGNVHSIKKDVLMQIPNFDKLLSLLMKSAAQKFNVFFPNQNLSCGLKRGWANEMHLNSKVKIHYHSNDNNLLVLIYYHKVPENSAKLAFIDTQYKKSIKNGFISFDDQIAEKDKKYVDVEEGMCLLHDGRLLHGVGEHKSVESRQSIIVDLFFPKIN